MDWSLVLLSQGIESVIEHSPEDDAWRLLVEPRELEPARSAIRLYRAENRRWAWTGGVGLSGAVFHWGALLWCWVLILLHWLVDAMGRHVAEVGVMSSAGFGKGEWWRLFTAVSLHADVAHLASNASTGLVVFGLGMARFGSGTTLLAGFIAGALGNLIAWLFHAPPYRALGASGMVMGGLGMLAVQSVVAMRESPKARKQFFVSLLGGFLLFVLVGLNPASDVLAHAGGFASGLLLGTLLSLLPVSLRHGARVRRTSWVVLLMLFAATWFLALRGTAAAAEHRGSRFHGWTTFSEWQRSSNSTEQVWLSPVVECPFGWDQLVVSWNAEAPAGTGLEFAVRALGPDRSTKWCSMGSWTQSAGVCRRQSTNGQKDSDGDVRTDTLALRHGWRRAQVRVTFVKPANDQWPRLKFVGANLLDTSSASPPLPPNRAAWGRTIDVPERSQVNYPGGAAAWCSPTCVSMVLAHWSKVLRRPELDQDVPAVVEGVFDPGWEGTGNWSFNTAFAGSFPQMRAYVTRLTDVREVEDWTEREVPVVASVSYDELRGRPRSRDTGHLVVCVGFTRNGDLVANDPGTSKSVRRTFARKDFAKAWLHSHRTAYLIYPVNHRPPDDRFGHWFSPQ